MTTIEVRHFSDPGCPWAYSARPAHARLRWRFGDQLRWNLVVIGLSENTDRALAAGYTPERMARGQRSFRDRFGMPFLLQPKARLHHTSRACRALVAVREQDPDRADAALRALQLMQFGTSGLLDDDEDLRTALATVDGIDADAAVAAIDAAALIQLYETDRAAARTAGGSPTHAQDRHSTSDGPVRYTAPSLVFAHEDGRTIEAGGFQPFEAYDLVLANLDPALERRPAPDGPLDAVRAFPEGLTTAEVASIMRPSDLVDPDPAAVADELLSLTAAGEVTRTPYGQDALWRTPTG